MRHLPQLDESPPKIFSMTSLSSSNCFTLNTFSDFCSEPMPSNSLVSERPIPEKNLNHA
ncbi:hypothetical protein DPMN_053797 [Dreissena polymorpha]|uniref:Uncharacterized protein n=1 Tax=Dreissena polymorpha TaxID=45954 RepID=A0A9D4CNR4_DREPO|nr:hypothetical protein DPMN_053797 [Dreissena polymorpha]